LGRDASALGVARWYRDIVGALVIDEVDAAHADAIEALGVKAIVMPTVMSSPEVTDRLAQTVCGLA